MYPSRITLPLYNVSIWVYVSLLLVLLPLIPATLFDVDAAAAADAVNRTGRPIAGG